MEDNLTNQEEQFRALSEEFTLDIDTSELWSKVEGQLPPIEGKRRRPIFWWFLAGVALIVAGLLGWNLQSKEVKASEQLMITQDLSSGHKRDSELSTTTIKEQHTQQTTLKILNDDEINYKSVLNDELKLDETKSENNSSSIEKSNSTVTSINYDRYDEKSTSRKDEAIDQNKEIVLSANEILIDPSFSEKTDESEPIIPSDRSMIAVNMVNTIGVNSLESKQEVELPSLLIEPVKQSQWMPYFSILSGINWHQREIFTDPNESLNLTQFENEKPLPAIKTNLRFGYENSAGWRFGLGLAHSRLVNRFRYKEEVVSSQKIEGTESFTIDDQGNVTGIEGHLIETTVYNYDLSWHRIHDFVNVELNLGKRIINYGNFAVLSDVFLSRNIWSNHSGYFLKENEIGINRFAKGEEHPYTNSGFEVGASVSLEYGFGPYSINVSPYYSRGLNTMTQSTNYYQIKNSQYGVQLGIVYRP